MINQVIYNLILYLLGYSLLTAGCVFSIHYRHVLAIFAGMSLWVTTTVILLLTSVKLSLWAVLALCISIIVILSWIRRRELFKFSHSPGWFIFYMVAFLIINAAVYYFDLTIFTLDSVKYVGLGHVIGEAGIYPPDGMPTIFTNFLMETRMGYLAVLNAGSYLFGIEIYNTILPLTAVYLMCATSLFVSRYFKIYDTSWKIKLLMAAMTLCMFLSVPAYWYHAYYIHQNMLTAAFFTFGIAGIFLYSKQDRQLKWLIMSGVGLAMCVLLRTEMTFYVLIPIAILISDKNLTARNYCIFLAIFIGVSAPWLLYKISVTGFERSRHEWGALQIIPLGSYVLSYCFVHFEWLKKRVAPHVPKIMSVVLVMIFLFGIVKYNAYSSFVNLLKIMFLGHGIHHWGGIWWAMTGALILHVFIDRRRALMFWIWVLLPFFLLRILLYSFGLFPEGQEFANMFQSGSRILIHIMPTAVLYIIYLLRASLSVSENGL